MITIRALDLDHVLYVILELVIPSQPRFSPSASASSTWKHVSTLPTGAPKLHVRQLIYTCGQELRSHC